MANTTFNILPSIDGKQYSQYPAGNYIPAPTGLTASASGSLVTLDFTDNTLGLATNILRRSTSLLGTYSDVATLAAGVAHYVDTPPTSGTYYYQVTAYFSGAPSAASNTANATIAAVVAPTLASPSMTSDGANITFSGGSGYTTLIPQYSSNAGATWTSIASDTTSPITYTGLAAGSYSFRALANGTVASNVVTGTVSASSFSLTALYAFGGGTNGAAVGILSKPNSGEVQTSYAGSYGSTYSTAQTRGGRSSSLRTTIKSGSDGDPSGGSTGTGMGLFGLNVTLPTTARCADGDTLHTIAALYFDSTFDTHTNTGILKFIRFLQSDGTFGHLDHLIVNDYGYIEGDTATAGPHSPHGFAFGNESDHSGEIWTSGYGFVSGIRTNRNVARGQWCIVEIRQKFSTNAAFASRTIWVDGQFVVDFTGNTKTYINQSGTLATLTGGQCANMLPGKQVDLMRIFTYWNGYAPKDQGVYIDAIGFYKIPSGQAGALPNTDEYGNKFIGLGIV